jgi:hypothetical protein
MFLSYPSSSYPRAQLTPVSQNKIQQVTSQVAVDLFNPYSPEQKAGYREPQDTRNTRNE